MKFRTDGSGWYLRWVWLVERWNLVERVGERKMAYAAEGVITPHPSPLPARAEGYDGWPGRWTVIWVPIPGAA